MKLLVLEVWLFLGGKVCFFREPLKSTTILKIYDGVLRLDDYKTHTLRRQVKLVKNPTLPPKN